MFGIIISGEIIMNGNKKINNLKNKSKTMKKELKKEGI